MTATLFVRSEFRDLDAWKHSWAGGADFMAHNGVLSASAHLEADHPNSVVVVQQFESVEAARAFAKLLDSQGFADGPVAQGTVVPESLQVWICEDL